MYKNYSKQILRTMRLITMFFIASLVQVSAATFGQHITINKRNILLESALKEIRKQSGYDFFYDGKIIPKNKYINLSLTNATIEQALEKVFQGLDYTYEIDGKRVAIKKKQRSFLEKIASRFQKIDIQGKIIDEKGSPLPGASIRIKPTNQIVVTDQNGMFEFKGVEENTILVVTFIGYNTLEAAVKEHLILQMEPVSASLNQVVVTGYQTISRERATGTFSHINSETLKSRPSSDLSSALQGLVAGMQGKENEDGSVSFLIRGSTSLFADKSPLIVVDGFPISGNNFSDLNPNDVESVTVLKDAAAASIWGARSGNGVIVVTTKKIKGNSPLKIEADAFTRISRRADLDQMLTTASSADHIAYERKAFENNWIGTRPYNDAFYYDVINPLTLAQELMYAFKNNHIDASAMNAGLDRLSKIDNRDQIKNLLMQQAILNQYNLNLQAGTERSKTYASLMYETSRGSFKKTGYNRFNLNLNNDFKLTSFLSFNFGLNLHYRKNETSGATATELNSLSPYEVLLNPDGSYGVNLNTYNRRLLSEIPAGSFPYADWSYNLLQEVNGRRLTDEKFGARIQTGLNLKLANGFSFDSRFQYERTKMEYQDYYDESTFYVRSLVNSMTTYDGSGRPGISYIPKGGILKSRDFGRGAPPVYRKIDLSNSNLESFLIRNQFNFDRSVGNQHQFSAIAGMEVSQYTNTGQGNPAVYGYDPDKLQSTPLPYGYGSSANPLSDFLGGGIRSTVPGGDPYFGWLRDKYVSFYGNASYTYNNKYTLSGSVRSDASNFITDNPKLRWSPLWSVGTKWNIKNEGFMANIKAIDRLELRLTYGKNGNVEKSTSTQALLEVSSSPSIYTGTIIASVVANGNPTLRWEKTSTFNLGVDFALLNDKLFGSVDLYHKSGKGIIGDITVPTYTGTTQQRFNNAAITNRGIELTLGAHFAIPNTPIYYSTSFTYAYNQNKITSLYSPGMYTYGYLNGDFVEGRPVNSIYSLTYKGMVNGIPQAEGPNGELYGFNDPLLVRAPGNFLNDHNYEGTATPPHTLGWINTIQACGFTLTAIFNGKLGGVYRNPTFNYGSGFVGSDKTILNKYVNEVLAGNPNLPGFPKANQDAIYLWDYYTPYLSRLVESSSYIECKELTLGYDFPKNWGRSIHLDRIKVFAQARDLGLIWQANSKGFHPEWLPGTNRPVQTYTFGINVQF